jgi:PAS domain S-box-containing protein
MNKPKIHILIVEDDLVDRMACRRALPQDPNYEFVLSEAETGREGLQLAISKKPDCVLLDYLLPDMNGLEFLAELRNDLGEVTVPVIMLTGADNASVAVEAMKLGAQDYLLKDVNRQYLELLPTVIQHMLRERQALEELRRHRSRMEDMVNKRTTKFENRAAVLESANANLSSKLEACTQACIELKKYANQLADFYHNAPCSYYSLNPEGMFIHINDTGLDWMGLTREEVVGKMRFTDLLTSASTEKFLKNYQHLKEHGWIHNLELDVTRKDGTPLTVLLCANAVKDSGDRFVMSRSMMLDITEQ